MKLRWLYGFAAVLLLLAACADTIQDKQPPLTTDSNVFVGQIEGTDALIALVIDGNTFTAYTCGQEESWQALTGWFEGTVAGTSITTTPGGWDMTLEASLSNGVWQGTLTASGRSHTFTAERARTDRPAGFYLLNTDSREAGLIIDNSLNTAGVYYGKSSRQTSPVTVTTELAGAGQLSSVRVSTTAYGGSSFTLQRTRTPFKPAPMSPQRELRQAIARAFPELKQYRLVNLEDSQVVATLRELAGNTAQNPDLATRPTYVSLPVIDVSGLVSNYQWTVYHHNVRSDDYGLELTDLDGGKELRVEDAGLLGPSLTFQGLPDLGEQAFRELLDEIRKSPTVAARQLRDETRFQASELAVINGQISGSYFGDAVTYPSILEGLGILLYPQYPAARVDQLLSQVDETYILYNGLHFNPDLTHGYPHVHTHSQAGQPQILRPQHHFLDDPWKSELYVTAIFDQTIYRVDLPEDERWLIPEAYGYVESAVNRQNSVWGFFSLHLDDATGDWSNSSFSVRTVVDKLVGLSEADQSKLDPDNEDHYQEDRCRDNNEDGSSFFFHIVELFKGKYEGDNMYKTLWTNAYGGGCAARGSLNGAINNNNKWAMAWVGLLSATADWLKGTYIHEAAHIVGGSHEIDNTGDTGETTHLQRCRLLGVLELGHEGPSILSYNRDVMRNLCLAYPTASGTPKKNLTIVAEFLHQNLK